MKDLGQLKFNLRELQVLDFVANAAKGKKNLTEIARALSLKKSNATTYVKKLERCGLAVVEKKGAAKLVSASPGIAFAFSSVKTVFPTLKFSDVLLGRRPFLLAFSLERIERSVERNAAEASKPFKIKDLDLPASSAKMLLSSLRGLGLVSMKKKGEYSLRAEAKPAADFCRRVLSFAYSFRAENELGALGLGALDQAVFSFDSAKSVEAVFVVRTPTSTEPTKPIGHVKPIKPKNYWLTGLSLAGDYGLKVIQAGKQYYCNVKPALVDVVMHVLAFDRGSRGVYYAAALAAKNNVRGARLLEKRQKFGLSEEFLRGFAEFVDSKGKKGERGEFEGLSFKEVEEWL